MTYGNTEAVKSRLGSLLKEEDGPGEITETMVIDAVNEADIRIKAELRNEGLTPPPDTAEDIDELKSAANLFARSDLLDTIYESTEGERSAAAKTFETRALDLIEKYINRPPSDDEAEERAPRIRSFVVGNYNPNTVINDEDED